MAFVSLVVFALGGCKKSPVFSAEEAKNAFQDQGFISASEFWKPGETIKDDYDNVTAQWYIYNQAIGNDAVFTVLYLETIPDADGVTNAKIITDVAIYSYDDGHYEYRDKLETFVVDYKVTTKTKMSGSEYTIQKQ